MYYISLAVIAIICICRTVTGFKKGLVKEIISLIATVIAVVCLILILGAIGNYLQHDIGNVVKSILILLVICLVYRLVNALLTSLELISKLPIINWLNKILGAVTGLAEGLILSGVLIYILKQWGLSFLI